MKITIQYYAQLREESGRSKEEIETQAKNPKELYGELQKKYRFKLPVKILKVAVNGEFAGWSQSLRNRDEVVFIPPVAGG